MYKNWVYHCVEPKFEPVLRSTRPDFTHFEPETKPKNWVILVVYLSTHLVT